MKPLKEERLGTAAAVKGTMLEAHLDWAAGRIAGGTQALASRLGPESAALVTGPFLVTNWIPLHCLVEIDRAIASAVGQPADTVLRELGRHSAQRTLAGVYKQFTKADPHRFFEQQALLHRRFCNFGRSDYARTGPTSGRISLREFAEFSPAFCTSGQGYYEAALAVMGVPGPIRVHESSCQCAGDPACAFDISW